MGEKTARMLQQNYYAQRASEYADAHLIPGDEHYVALEYISAFVLALRSRVSILDVGAGTGRAMAFLSTRHSGSRIVGVEPSAELRAEAERAGFTVLNGSGEDLPFADREFDVVLATGVMHHVAEPAKLVQEMLRVSRVAIFISDANRYGQGASSIGRKLKRILGRLHLWSLAQWIRTSGRMYMISEGDGLFYSYSLYDSYPAVRASGRRTFVIPTGTLFDTSPHAPTGGHTHGLLCGIDESAVPGWGVPENSAL